MSKKIIGLLMVVVMLFAVVPSTGLSTVFGAVSLTDEGEITECPVTTVPAGTEQPAITKPWPPTTKPVIEPTEWPPTDEDIVDRDVIYADESFIVAINAYENKLFKFIPEETGYYQFSSQLEEITLYDSEYNCLISNNDNFNRRSVVYYLQAGEIYYWGLYTYSSDVVYVSLSYNGNCILKGEAGTDCGFALYPNGRMVFEGEGDMGIFEYGPWYTYENYIKYGCINEGITSVGAYTFACCDNLETVYIPMSVTRICHFAFNGSREGVDIYYPGTEEQWKNIYIENDFLGLEDSLKSAIIHFEHSHSDENSDNLCEECYVVIDEDIPVDVPTTQPTTAPTTTLPTTTKAPVSTTKEADLSVPAEDETNSATEEEPTVASTTNPTTQKEMTTSTPVPTTTLPATTKPIVSTTKKQEIAIKAKKPAKPKIKKPKSTKAKQAVITWNVVKTANGYQIAYSTSKKFTKKVTNTKVIKKAKTTKTTLKKLKSGKKYFIKVRAYKTVNGKKIYGAYSKVMTVKVK